MVYLNLQAIIDNYYLDKDILALLLFPENKFPKTALYRITTNEAFLTSEQVYELADFLGVTIDELYKFGGAYKEMPTNKKDIVIFKKWEYSININTRTGIATIYNAKKPVTYLKVLTSKTITLEELFSTVDDYILNKL